MGERMGRWIVRAAVAAAVAGVIALGWAQRRRFAPVTAGDRAPAYAAPSLAGDTVSLGALRGKVVLLNVWATWCAPCRWEMPALDRLHRALRDRGLEVVAVSVDAAPGGPDGAVREMVEELGLSFTVLVDPAGEVRRRFGVSGLPTTFLIGRDGTVLERVLGPARWDRAPHADRVREALEG